MHSHHHGHHGHSGLAVKRLVYALTLTLAFAVVEVVGGLRTGSLALLSDAGHMLSDSAALGIAAIAAWIGRRPPSVRHTYGFARAEVVAAFINGLVMMVVVTMIGYEAIVRLRAPYPVQAPWVMAIAGVGLLVNVMVLALLRNGPHDLNTRAASLHVLGDFAGSVVALLAGTIIYYTNWTPIDPILSLLIVVLIIWSTIRLLRDSLRILMEGVPSNLDTAEIGRRLAGVSGVQSIHDLHIWTALAGAPVLSAHVVVENLANWNQTLDSLRDVLKSGYGIEHVTLQPEPRIGVEPLNFVRRPGRDSG